MKSIDVLNSLKSMAKEYKIIANESVCRNNHMNGIDFNAEIDQKVIDAILTDYINYVAYKSGIDYGLYTKDLNT